MNFSIDARGSTLYKGSGIGTYIENLIHELLNLDKINNYTIFWTGDNYKDLIRENVNIILTSKRHSSFFENHYYPNFIKEHDINLHHIPQNGLGLYKNYNFPCIVTIHDLIPYIMPETVGLGYLERFLSDMPYIIKNTLGILTVSEYSKMDILKFFPNFPKNNIFVTPLAANKTFKPLNSTSCKDYLLNKYKIDFPFVLYVGGFSKRKNVKELILSFNEIYHSLKKDYRLVILGSLKDEGEKLKEFSKSLNISDKIIFTGFIPDEELPIFYNSSSLFVYPSLYEGFGLPILEAMSCNTAVITSNITSIPEIALNNSAILIDPHNQEQLSSSMMNILNSDDLLNEYAAKGYNNSKNFNWKKTAELTLEAYEKISQIQK